MDKLRFLYRWILRNAHYSLVVFYFILALFLRIFTSYSLSVSWIIFLLAFGTLLSALYREWKHSGNYEDIDLMGFDDGGNKEEGFFSHFKEMPWWEKMHWIPILGFLFLTGYAMHEGLALLFTGGKDWFVLAFSAIVVMVLLWLVIMISRRVNIVGFVLFYICFDALSAFSFNFVHFYSNVSRTQHMERDMKYCQRYLEVQMLALKQIEGEITTKITDYNATNKALEKQNKKSESSLRASVISARQALSKEEKSIFNDRAKSTGNEIIGNNKGIAANERNIVRLQGLSANLDTIKQRRDSLNSLCLKYKEHPLDFEEKELHASKALVTNIQTLVEAMVASEAFKDFNKNINVKNDTIQDLVRRLERNETDRFESINKLVSLLCSTVGVQLDDAKQEEQVAANDTVVKVQPAVEVNNKPVRATEDLKKARDLEEERFENRLLYLSAALSILIDVLPLALGVFVAYSRKRRSE